MKLDKVAGSKKVDNVLGEGKLGRVTLCLMTYTQTSFFEPSPNNLKEK